MGQRLLLSANLLGSYDRIRLVGDDGDDQDGIVPQIPLVAAPITPQLG